MLESCSKPSRPNVILDLWQMLNCRQDKSVCCDGKYRTPAQVLALLPCAEGKTQPVSYYAAKYLQKKAQP